MSITSASNSSTSTAAHPQPLMTQVNQSFFKKVCSILSGQSCKSITAVVSRHEPMNANPQQLTWKDEMPSDIIERGQLNPIFRKAVGSNMSQRSSPTSVNYFSQQSVHPDILSPVLFGRCDSRSRSTLSEASNRYPEFGAERRMELDEQLPKNPSGISHSISRNDNTVRKAEAVEQSATCDESSALNTTTQNTLTPENSLEIASIIEQATNDLRAEFEKKLEASQREIEFLKSQTQSQNIALEAQQKRGDRLEGRVGDSNDQIESLQPLHILRKS